MRYMEEIKKQIVIIKTIKIISGVIFLKIMKVFMNK